MSRQEMIATIQANQWNVRDEYKNLSLTEIQCLGKQDRLPYAVCCVNITGDLNVGVMMRSAVLLGAERFIIFGSKKYDRRTTVGAQNYIDVHYIDGRSDIWGNDNYDLDYIRHNLNDHLIWNNYVPVYVETGGTNISSTLPGLINNLKGSIKKPCLIFGNEGIGIPKELIDNQIVVSIPQRGALRSLNVSTAAGIAMYEMQRILTEVV